MLFRSVSQSRYTGTTTIGTPRCDIIKIPDQQLALTGSLKMVGTGTVSLVTLGDTMFVSGKTSSAINFFFPSPSSGYRVAEALICNKTNLSGYMICASGNLNSTITGNFYKISLDNQSKTTIFNFGIPSGYSAQTGNFFYTFDPYTKVGIDLPNYPDNEVGNLAFAVFGYE